MFLQGLRTTCIKVGSYSIMTAHLCKPVLVKIKGSSNHTLVIQIRILIYVHLLLFCLFLFFPVKFLVVKPIHSSNKSGYILSYYKHTCSRNMVWGWGSSCLELPNSSCISFKKKNNKSLFYFLLLHAVSLANMRCFLEATETAVPLKPAWKTSFHTTVFPVHPVREFLFTSNFPSGFRAFWKISSHSSRG